MRLALIGTSNGLLADGLSRGLSRSPHVGSFANLSLGGSCSLLAHLQMTGLDLGQFDVCLLDFAVNETPFVANGIGRAALSDYTRAVVAEVLAQGSLPVMIVLPRRDQEERHEKLTRHHLALARELNLPYLDVIDLVRRLALQMGIERSLLFKDDAHLTRWFANALGQEICHALRILLRRRAGFIDKPWSANRFVAIPLLDLVPPERRQHRRSSLFAMSFAELHLDEPLTVPVPGPMHAFWFNELGSGGILRIAGDTASHVDLRNLSEIGKRRFLGELLPLRQPVPPRDGTLTLEAVPLAAVPDTSRSGLQFTTRGKGALPDLGLVELGGIVAQQPEPLHVPRRPAPAQHVDLTTLMPQTALRVAIDIALTHRLDYPRSRDAPPPPAP